MNNRSPKNRFSRIGSRIFRRQLYYVINPLRRFRSRILYGLYRFLPVQIRFIFPSLTREFRNYAREELKKRQQGRSSDLESATDLPDPQQLIQERSQLLPKFIPDYLQYRCLEENPLGCYHARQTTENNPQAKHCLHCGFPAILPYKSEIIGQKSRYRIINYLETRGRGRLYQGIQVDNEQPVTIKEYLLPNLHFNQEEKYHTHNAFKNQGSIDLVDGRRQDFRLWLNADAISPPPQDRQIVLITQNEVINDRAKDQERCFLVTPGVLEQLPTLRSYLIKQGAMSALEVRQVLNQVLQTLESLHHQKFRLPTGQIYAGLPHSNLSLESILIAVDSSPFFAESQLTIYLSDLALWEDLFRPPPRLPHLTNIRRDLVALGYVGFYLLKGQSIEENNFNLSPHNNLNWVNIEPIFKQYIFRLLELDTPFADAFTARQALLNLPLESPTVQPLTTESQDNRTPNKKRFPWRWLLLICLIFLLTGGCYWWWNLQRQAMALRDRDPVICCIADIVGIPQGTFNYTAEENGIWNYILLQKNLISKNLTLRNKLAEKTPKFQLEYLPKNTEIEALKSIQADEANFAIITSVDRVNRNLKSEPFAYDGIAVFIAFSQDESNYNLLNSLKGKITFEQLRQLYTGQITNWKQLGAADIPVKLYIPDSESTIELFQQKVFQNQRQIAAFQSLLPQDNEFVTKSITRLPILPMLRKILPEFENEQIGSIGFGNFSEIFGQCSVYPLAIVPDHGKPIQPLIQNNLKPITPKLDLCKEKGSYTRDKQLFQTQRYPLTYSLAVVYPKDNSIPPAGEKFAEILKTEEGQKLLSKIGLIPLNN